VSTGPILSRPAVAYADQALFHPLAYLSGLAQQINADGSLVCEGAEVGGVIDDPLAVIVNGENIACDDLIIATHVPLTGLTNILSATLFQTKLFPYTSYVFGARMPRGTLAPGLYSDTSDPYYYLRVHDTDADTYAIFGGEDHKTGQVKDTEECFARLEQKLGELLPNVTVERRWSGQVIETSDGLPFMGNTSDHQFVATGYSGNGLTFGTLAGMVAHDHVMGTDNPWRELYDPHRKKLLCGLASVISENIDYPVYLILDRLRQDRRSGVESVRRGEGGVLMIGGEHVACHRTDDGTLIKVKAVCTHLGCLVRWNTAERTWDCPCHGSRFSPEGMVLGGPAEDALERL
jgi:Rieske Fe-S protein